MRSKTLASIGIVLLRSAMPAPGAGLGTLELCGQRDVQVGRGNQQLVPEWILRDAAVAASDALVVGDRVDTDIVAGQRAGCPVHLVLTGVTETPPAGIPWSADLTGVLAPTRT